MKISINISTIALFFFIAFVFTPSAFAQEPPPPPPSHGSGGNVPGGGAPIGGGVLILTLLGAGYGAKQWINSKRNFKLEK